MSRLNGNVPHVTGAVRGIGAAIVRAIDDEEKPLAVAVVTVGRPSTAGAGALDLRLHGQSHRRHR